MPITLEPGESLTCIRLEGAVDISSAVELKQRLMGAQSSGKQVRLSMLGATDLDVTAVQLLWAADREARASGVPFALEGELPGQIVTALAAAGIETFPVSEMAR